MENHEQSAIITKFILGTQEVKEAEEFDSNFEASVKLENYRSAGKEINAHQTVEEQLRSLTEIAEEGRLFIWSYYFLVLKTQQEKKV